MPNRLFFIPRCIAVLAFGLCFASSPSYAGFQWVAPTAPMIVEAPAVSMPAPQPAPAPLVITAPQATMSPEPIAPVIIGGDSGVMSSANSTAPASSGVPSVGTVNSTPVVSGGSAPSTTTYLAPPPDKMSTLSVSPSVSGGDAVRGFANQVPLAVALRQILPAGYGFSVDPDVDLGVLISFQGGKSWRETLQDALEPAGLVMREQGQMVSVGHGVIRPTHEPVVLSSMPSPQAISVPPGELATLPMVASDPRSPLVEQWSAERGDNLHKVIQNWAKRAGVEVNWLAEYDYPLQASFNVTGTFEEAIRILLTGFQEAHPQPVAELHNNPGVGQKVLVVQTRGNSYSK